MSFVKNKGMIVMNENYLFDYAFCGTPNGFNKMLSFLADIAEEEKWTFDEKQPNLILQKYILGTFSQCQKQNKIMISNNGEHSCFNTGLLTTNGNDIIAIFDKNKRLNKQPWVLRGFKDKCNRGFMDLFSEIPLLATYTEKYEDLYFNPEYNIIVNTDHILDDNWDRIESTVHLNKAIVKTLLVGVVEEAKERIKRNLRLVVPQYYRDEIMCLVPIKIPVNNDSYETMALAVEKTNTNQYRASTIFTKEMAYEKARLLMKPESNWLVY